MPLKKFSITINHLTVAALTAAAGVALAAYPVKALVVSYSFCGTFDDGGTVDGTIVFESTANTSSGAVIDFQAKSSTSQPGSTINWTENDFTNLFVNVAPNLTSNPNAGNFGGGYSRQYEFNQSAIALYINLPESYFPSNFPAIGDPPIRYNMAEFRNIGDPPIWRKDVDDIRRVPAPLPVMGAAVTIAYVRKLRSSSKRLNAYNTSKH